MRSEFNVPLPVMTTRPAPRPGKPDDNPFALALEGAEAGARTNTGGEAMPADLLPPAETASVKLPSQAGETADNLPVPVDDEIIAHAVEQQRLLAGPVLALPITARPAAAEASPLPAPSPAGEPGEAGPAEPEASETGTGDTITATEDAPPDVLLLSPPLSLPLSPPATGIRDLRGLARSSELDPQLAPGTADAAAAIPQPQRGTDLPGNQGMVVRSANAAVIDAAAIPVTGPTLADSAPALPSTAVPAAATGTPPLPTIIGSGRVDEIIEDWANRIAEGFAERPGSGSIRFRLTPAALGDLDVRIHLEQGQARVEFGVASDAARAMLEPVLPRLAQLLEARGAGLPASGYGAAEGRPGNPGGAQPGRDGQRRNATRSAVSATATPLNPDLRNEGRISVFA